MRLASNDGRAIQFDRDGSRFSACALRSAGAWDPQGRRQQWKDITDDRLIEHLAVHPTGGSVVRSAPSRPTFTHVSAVPGRVARAATEGGPYRGYRRGRPPWRPADRYA